MLFVDSADPREVQACTKLGASGVTTNPLIVSRQRPDAKLETIVREVLGVSVGDVSVEVLNDAGRSEIREWCLMDPRVVVKLPFSAHSLELLSGGWDYANRINMTCIMTSAQAVLAKNMGCKYASIFWGRVRDMGYDPAPVVRESATLLAGSNTRIIVGSIRHPRDVIDALLAGAHVVTVPPEIFHKLLWNPQTERTIAEFEAAGRK